MKQAVFVRFQMFPAETEIWHCFILNVCLVSKTYIYSMFVTLVYFISPTERRFTSRSRSHDTQKQNIKTLLYAYTVYSIKPCRFIRNPLPLPLQWTSVRIQEMGDTKRGRTEKQNIKTVWLHFSLDCDCINMAF